jgi:hypothetical protein
MGERHQVRVAESLGDLGHPGEGGFRGRGVAPLHALERDRHEQVALLHAIEWAVLEQPMGPGEPAAAAGHLAPEQQPEAQPERAPRRARGIAQTQALAMRTRPLVGALAVPADQIRGRRQTLEVFDFERRLVSRGRQVSVGVSPGLPPEGLPAPSERVGRGLFHQGAAPWRPAFGPPPACARRRRMVARLAPGVHRRLVHIPPHTTGERSIAPARPPRQLRQW